MEIQITTHAHRQLRKLPADVQAAVMRAVGHLSSWPNTRNVKILRNRPGYRLRVGRYRVIFEVGPGVIWIIEAAIRNEETYQER